MKLLIVLAFSIFTEGTKGAVSRSDGMMIPNCWPGTYLDSEKTICQHCPLGTYQDQPGQSSCKPCGPDHTTPAEGQSSALACYNTNQCETGENECSWHATCLDLPDEGVSGREAPRFQCTCKPGFTGDGKDCQDACIDYCLNGGLCRKRSDGSVYCDCVDDFTGERCEEGN